MIATIKTTTKAILYYRQRNSTI